MGKSIHDNVLDAALDYIADNGDRLFVCTSEPTTYAEASTTYNLASHNMTEGDGNGDYTIQNGDTSGRRLTVAEQASISVDSTGDAEHIAICDSVAELVLLVTTCTSQTLTSGNTVTVPTFDDEILDPS